MIRRPPRSTRTDTLFPYTTLFRSLGPVTLRNRIIKSATFEGKTPDALVTDELIEFHRRPAAGGVGLSTVAYCAVPHVGRPEYGQLCTRPDAHPRLRRLPDPIRSDAAAASATPGPACPVANQKSAGQIERQSCRTDVFRFL